MIASFWDYFLFLISFEGNKPEVEEDFEKLTSWIGAAAGLLLGLIGGFNIGGVGGAIIGAPIGVVFGFILAFLGLFLIRVLFAILIFVAFWGLIASLWGVGN